mmetsp:Transcript_838/g.2644  ORF Transcript_838/g.2644 Transcript_838/m.2644 type:complete len:318 (-) Transcript_838:85-1038(-)
MMQRVVRSVLVALLVWRAVTLRVKQDAAGPEMERVVRLAIQDIEYPNKIRAWDHVKKVGRIHQRRFPGYSFVQRGGLSSPHVKFITDIDLIFNNPRGGRVTIQEYGDLKALAIELCEDERNIIAAKVSYRGEDKFDNATQDLEMVGGIVEGGADLAVITCRYELRGGWLLPMDIALQRGESKMSKARRRQRIFDNLGTGNYAKAVQRIRPLLQPEGKRELAEAWNKEGGALRFLVKQLELLSGMSEHRSREYLQKLHIPEDPLPEEWAKAAENLMQKVALDVLLAKRHLVIPKLGDEGERIYEEMEAAERRLLYEYE